MEKDEQWTQVQKPSSSKPDSRLEGKETQLGNRVNVVVKKNYSNQVVEKVEVLSNPFIALCPLDDQTPPTLKEGEVQHSNMLLVEGEVTIGPQEYLGHVLFEIPCADPILQEIHKSPLGSTTSPSYA